MLTSSTLANACARLSCGRTGSTHMVMILFPAAKENDCVVCQPAQDGTSIKTYFLSDFFFCKSCRTMCAEIKQGWCQDLKLGSKSCFFTKELNNIWLIWHQLLLRKSWYTMTSKMSGPPRWVGSPSMDLPVSRSSEFKTWINSTWYRTPLSLMSSAACLSIIAATTVVHLPVWKLVSHLARTLATSSATEEHHFRDQLKHLWLAPLRIDKGWLAKLHKTTRNNLQ